MDANSEITVNTALRDMLTLGMYSIGIAAGALVGLAALLLAA